MPWLSRAVRLLPVFPLIFFCLSCSDFWVSNSSTQSIKVSPSALVLKAATSTTAGDTSSLSATATTVGGTTEDVTSAAKWTSNNTAVTVSAGKLSVTGTSGGLNVVITASDGGQSATCNILTYTGTAPSTLNINFPSGLVSTAVSPGTYSFTATASINNSNNYNITQYVTWSSTNTSAATVDVNGNVTVLSTASAGATFTITATANVSGNNVTGTSTTFTVV